MPTRVALFLAVTALAATASAGGPPPAAARPALKPEDLKTTVVALTTKLRDDKTKKLWLEYSGHEVELTGVVLEVTRDSDGGCLLELLGCPFKKLYQPEHLPYRASMGFPADVPLSPRLKNLTEGDTVTVRGTFGLATGVSVRLKDPVLVAGGEKPPVPLASVRTADAGVFVKDLMNDWTLVDKLRGQAVTLTGPVSGSHSGYDRRGLSLAAGKVKPTDPHGAFVECDVVEEQLTGVWQLGPGLKVRVVGVVGLVTNGRVRLARCRVTQLEPNPIPTVAAAVLAAAFRAEPHSAAKKYGGVYVEKPLFLTGEVAAVTPTKSGSAVTLKVPGGLRVETGTTRREADGLKVGQTVRFKAVCRGLTDDGAAVRVSGSLLPEPKTPLPLAK